MARYYDDYDYGYDQPPYGSEAARVLERARELQQHYIDSIEERRAGLYPSRSFAPVSGHHNRQKRSPRTTGLMGRCAPEYSEEGHDWCVYEHVPGDPNRRAEPQRKGWPKHYPTEEAAKRGEEMMKVFKPGGEGYRGRRRSTTQGSPRTTGLMSRCTPEYAEEGHDWCVYEHVSGDPNRRAEPQGKGWPKHYRTKEDAKRGEEMMKVFKPGGEGYRGGRRSTTQGFGNMNPTVGSLNMLIEERLQRDEPFFGPGSYRRTTGQFYSDSPVQQRQQRQQRQQGQQRRPIRRTTGQFYSQTPELRGQQQRRPLRRTTGQFYSESPEQRSYTTRGPRVANEKFSVELIELLQNSGLRPYSPSDDLVEVRLPEGLVVVSILEENGDRDILVEWPDRESLRQPLESVTPSDVARWITTDSNLPQSRTVAGRTIGAGDLRRDASKLAEKLEAELARQSSKLSVLHRRENLLELSCDGESVKTSLAITPEGRVRVNISGVRGARPHAPILLSQEDASASRIASELISKVCGAASTVSGWTAAPSVQNTQYQPSTVGARGSQLVRMDPTALEMCMIHAMALDGNRELEAFLDDIVQLGRGGISSISVDRKKKALIHEKWGGDPTEVITMNRDLFCFLGEWSRDICQDKQQLKDIVDVAWARAERPELASQPLTPRDFKDLEEGTKKIEDKKSKRAAKKTKKAPKNNSIKKRAAKKKATKKKATAKKRRSAKKSKGNK